MVTRSEIRLAHLLSHFGNLPFLLTKINFNSLPSSSATLHAVVRLSFDEAHPSGAFHARPGHFFFSPLSDLFLFTRATQTNSTRGRAFKRAFYWRARPIGLDTRCYSGNRLYGMFNARLHVFIVKPLPRITCTLLIGATVFQLCLACLR